MTRQENQVSGIPVQDVKLEPKTPHGLVLPSPGSTQPSEACPETRGGTPPPADLKSDGQVTSASGPMAAARGGRRARAAVSYVEPKLNVKMRRPSKQLIDAVSHDGRRSESAEAKFEPAASTEEAVNRENKSPELPTTSKPVKASHESRLKVSERDRRGEPKSPLSDRCGACSNSPQKSFPEKKSQAWDRAQAVRKIASSDLSPRRKRAIEQVLNGNVKGQGGIKDIFDVVDSPNVPYGRNSASPTRSKSKQDLSKDFPHSASASSLIGTSGKESILSRQTSSKTASRRRTMGSSSLETSTSRSGQPPRPLGHKRSGGISSLTNTTSSSNLRAAKASSEDLGRGRVNPEASGVNGAVIRNGGGNPAMERANRIAARRRSMLV